jgi:UDP-N-acetylmuramyl pentapeptide phosphotransferase/UDP-N-acetylglucosamine-1-phosphate transferase
MSEGAVLIATGAALATGFLATRLLIRAPGSFWPVDYPNERSLHEQPVRRVGGIAILLALLVGMGSAWGLGAALPPARSILVPIGAGLMLVFGSSLWDDFRATPIALRLAIQGLSVVPLAAAGLMFDSLGVPGFSIPLPVPVAIVLGGLWVVWMSNLYNFMDGTDGLAGAMSVFGFGAMAAIGFFAGHDGFALVAGLIAAGTLGFLVLNWPPARVFMGDGGSVSLGYLAASLTLWAQHEGIFPLWVGALLFLPFIGDATVTLVGRLLRGESPARAHREHAYQKLVRLGYRKSQVLAWSILCMMGAALSGTWAAMTRSPGLQAALFTGDLVGLAAVLAIVHALKNHREQHG